MNADPATGSRFRTRRTAVHTLMGESGSGKAVRKDAAFEVFANTPEPDALRLPCAFLFFL